MHSTSRRSLRTFDGSVLAILRAVGRFAPADLKRVAFRWKTPSVIWDIPERGVLFVHVPKVATVSMRAALASFAAGYTEVDPGLVERLDGIATGRYQRNAYPTEIRQRRGDRFTFAFVRNPLDRLLSAYSDKVTMTPDESKNLFSRHGISLKATFPEFVARVAELSDDRCDVHLRSQHRFISDRDGLVVDYVGRFERLDTDWKALMDRFAFPPLPQRNVSSHKPYPESYTPELARVVAERYRRDIELFGYSDEVARLID